MSLNIDMTAQEIALLKQIIQLDNDAEAVTKAAREFLRLSRLRELKAVSGRVDFENNWQELEDVSSVRPVCRYNERARTHRN